MPCGFLVATTDVAYVALVSYLAVEVAHDHADIELSHSQSCLPFYNPRILFLLIYE